MTTVVIKRNHSTHIKVLATIPVTIFIAVRSLVNNINHESPRTLAILVISVILLLLLLLLINAIVGLTRRSAALVIHSGGITDNVSSIKAGLIPWSNIVGCQTGRLHGSKHLLILVNDKDVFTGRLSEFRRRMVESSLKKFNTPIAINLKTIRADEDYLVPLITTGISLNEGRSSTPTS